MRGIARIFVCVVILGGLVACGSDKGGGGGGGTGSGLGGGLGGQGGGNGAGGKAGGQVFGSCAVQANSICMDFMGADFQANAQQAAANCQQQGGTPAQTPCATAGVVGTCTVNQGQGTEMAVHAYAPVTKADVQQECAGLGGQVVGLSVGF